MRINSNYTSDISILLKSAGKETIFLSSWNKDSDLLDFPLSKAKLYNCLNKNEINKYFFSDEFFNLKCQIISDNIDFDKNAISANNFTFVSNGTIAALLCLLTIFKEKRKIKALLLSPIYYIYINILKDLGGDIFVQPGYNIDLNKISNEINAEKINLVIVNNPLFGTGECISRKVLASIQKLLLKNEGFLLIDNIYNGLKWNEKASKNDFKLFKTLNSYNNFVITESLSKNLYLNGIKHCSIFSNTEYIKKIEENSVYLCGSITASQYKFIERLYSRNEHQFVIEQLNKNVEYAKKTYNFILSILIKSDFFISKCESGGYCLLGIPRKYFDSNDDISIALEILARTNILTLPHDRYLFNLKPYYCFRVNLMTERNILFHALNKLQKSFNA